MSSPLRRRAVRPGLIAVATHASGFRYSTYPKTLNVTPRSGEFMVYRNGYATDSIWSDLTGFVDSVVTRVIDRRPFGLNNALAQKRFVRRYSKNAAKQLASIAVNVRAAGSGTVLSTLTARGFGYDDNTRALSSLTVGSTAITLDRDDERKPELWTFPNFQRAIQYTPRHEGANSYYSVPSLQGLFGRSYAFQTSSGRMTQISRAWAGDTLLVRTLGYTPRGQLKQLADSLIASPTCTNTGGTLTDGVVCTGGAVALKSLTFLYDSAGNQTRQLDNLGGADSLSATYGAANRLNGIAGVTYTYDDDGNVASRTTASDTVYFTYDASSRLVTVRAGADTTFYGYNALGQLVTRSRNENSGTNKRNLERVFFWDGDHLMAEMDSTLVTRVGEWAYYPGIDSPLGVVTSTSGGGTKLRFYHQDEIGNVIGLTDSSAMVQALEYGPWGDVVASTGGAVADTSRLQWKGLIWEGGKTQLYYVRNRWYDPVARRFISEDPIGVDGGLNLYAFGESDPINMIDPSGLDGYQGDQWCWGWTDGYRHQLTCEESKAPPDGGFSKNFGNPCARGGQCSPAAEPRGPTIGPGGGTPTGDQLREMLNRQARDRADKVQSCIADLGLLALNGALDFTAFGKTLRLLKAGASWSRVGAAYSQAVRGNFGFNGGRFRVVGNRVHGQPMVQRVGNFGMTWVANGLLGLQSESAGDFLLGLFLPTGTANSAINAALSCSALI